MIAKLVNLETRVIVGSLAIVGSPSCSGEKVSGIGFFNIEGGRYTLTFDYYENQKLFDGLTTTDKLFYNEVLTFQVFDKSHFVYIPYYEGLNIDYKTGLVTVNGTDAVGRSIKKLTEKDIDIRVLDSRRLSQAYNATEIFPEPIDVYKVGTNLTWFDRNSYKIRSALDYILNESGISHEININNTTLPRIDGGYRVLDSSIDDNYVFFRKFEPLRPEGYWYREDRLPQRLKNYPYSIEFVVPCENRGVVFLGGQYYYQAGISPDGRDNTYPQYVLEHYYRVQAVLAFDDPLFLDTNIDGTRIYDGRSPQRTRTRDTAGGASEEGYYESLQGGAKKDIIVSRTRISEQLKTSAILMKYRSELIYPYTNTFRSFQYYLRGVRATITIPKPDRYYTAPVISGITLGFTNDSRYDYDGKETFGSYRYNGSINMKFYGTEKLGNPEDELPGTIKSVKASSLARDILMSSTSVLKNGRRGDVLVQDKVFEYTNQPVVTINRHNVIEMKKTAKQIDIGQLATYSNVAFGDERKTYLQQYYESIADKYYNVIILKVDIIDEINISDFLNIEGVGIKYVAMVHQDMTTGLQTLEVWDA